MSPDSSHDYRLSLLNRSNTPPVCATCGYRMVAIDVYRDACEHCGEILGNDIRGARALAIAFGGKVVRYVNHGDR